MKQAYVYVDGFNLYYALKDTPYKWLNLRCVVRALLPHTEIQRIKYFTARVSARPEDPEVPTRQQIYLRALKTLPELEIIFGHFLQHTVWMRLAHPPSSGSPYVQVLKTEEKGSDVNLASHLLADGFLGRYELAVVISNDSDLVTPIKMVQTLLNRPVIVLNPHPKRPSRQIRKYARFVKPIRRGVLKHCQFPPILQDAQGTFHKPPEWT